MLTLTKLGEMQPEQRTELFDRMFQELWPESTNRAETAMRELGITKPTFFAWRRKHRVPPTVILLMQEWLKAYGPESEIGQWAEVSGQLSTIASTVQEVTAQIGQLADRLAQLVDRRAAAQGQTSLSAPEPGPETPQSFAE